MKVLQEYEGFFDTAYHFGFKHYTSTKANETVADIYEAAGGVFYRNWSCGHCVMQVFKGAGENYYRTKEKMEKAEAKKEAKKETKVEKKDKK